MKYKFYIIALIIYAILNGYSYANAGFLTDDMIFTQQQEPDPWYQGKTFTIYLQRYISKPVVYPEVEILDIIDKTIVKIKTYDDEIMYIPITSIVKIVEEKGK